MEVDPNGDQPEPDGVVDRPEPGDVVGEPDQPGAGGPIAWFRRTNHNPAVVAMIRRARQVLPGDPNFGDPLSTAGEGGVQAAARAAERLMPDKEVASREVGLAGLQLWQAVTQRVSGRPSDAEVTLVFTDLVGFSDWSLRVGDEATLKLLRRVAQVAEPPVLDAGGKIVKRMGDGLMAVFGDPSTAVAATVAAMTAVGDLEVDGYRPRMRAGIHTGRPQHIGGDWLGVDVNIAARVMERATRGGLIASETTLAAIPPEELESLGVTPKRVRRVFASRQQGVPAELAMYWLKTRRDPPGHDDEDDDPYSAS